MKKDKMLGTIGGILILVGMIIAFSLGVFGNQTEKFEIPAGDYCYYFEVPSSAVGQIKEDFNSDSGIVDMYIFTANQYKTYIDWGKPLSGYLYFKSGNSGAFTCNLSGNEKIYIVFDHGIGYQNIAQSVTAHLNTSAVDFTMLIPGIALIVIGAVVAYYGSRVKKKEILAEQTKQSSKVIMFDEKKQ